MISYKPLFKQLIQQDLSKTQFREAVGFSTVTLAKLSKNQPVSLEIIDRICNYLHCSIEDVIEHIPDESKEA